MDYIKNFTDSFKLWWNHKYLWIIGFIGLVLSGAGSVSQIQNSFKADSPIFKASFLESPAIIIIGIIVALISLAIAVVGIYLQLRADSSLIQSAKLLREDKKLNFKQAWTLGNKYLTKLFVNSLLISLPVFLLVFILAISIIVGIVSLAMPLLAIPLFLISFVVFLLLLIYIIVAAVVRPIADRMIVLEEKGNIEAIKLAFSFVKKNLGAFAMVYLILIGINLAISAVSWPLFLVVSLVVLPASLLMAVNPILGLLAFIFAQLIVSILSALVTGPLTALVSVYWTNSYLEIKQDKK